MGSGQIAGPVTVTVSNTNSEVATGQMHFYEKLVFLSQNKGAAALNQTTATATAFCAQAAANAGLTGSYVAWYSDSKNSDSAIDHFPPAGGPWSRPDGVLVASDLADLTDGNINAAIYIDEYGNDNSSISIVVATNTDISGNFKPDQCTGDPVTDTGTAGSRNRTDSAWTFSTNKSCNAILSYYCFEE